MKRQYFAFLRRLQAKGRSNMYGAVPYLMQAFGLDRERAFTVVCEWIDLQAATLQGTSPADARHSERTMPAGVKRIRRNRATV